MEQKATKGKQIAMIIFAVLIALEVGICAFLYFRQGVEKLAQKKEPGNPIEDVITEEEQQSGIQVVSLDSFVVDGKAGNKAEQKNEQETLEEEAEQEYLCSYSSERLLTEADVVELREGTYENLPEGKNIFQMVINEMYARYGYQFQNPAIQSYFEQKEWYQDIVVRNTDMEDVLSGMTEIEKNNVQFLAPYGEEE